MEQYISLNAIVAEIKRRISLFKKEKKTEKWSAGASQMNIISLGARIAMLEEILSFLDTLEVKEIPETTHTECKKIKKLCEIQRYDGDGKAYSVMLPDIRLFMNKINEIIDAIDNIDSRLQIMEQKIGE